LGAGRDFGVVGTVEIGAVNEAIVVVVDAVVAIGGIGRLLAELLDGRVTAEAAAVVTTVDKAVVVVVDAVGAAGGGAFRRFFAEGLGVFGGVVAGAGKVLTVGEAVAVVVAAVGAIVQGGLEAVSAEGRHFGVEASRTTEVGAVGETVVVVVEAVAAFVEAVFGLNAAADGLNLGVRRLTTVKVPAIDEVVAVVVGAIAAALRGAFGAFVNFRKARPGAGAVGIFAIGQAVDVVVLAIVAALVVPLVADGDKEANAAAAVGAVDVAVAVVVDAVGTALVVELKHAAELKDVLTGELFAVEEVVAVVVHLIAAFLHGVFGIEIRLLQGEFAAAVGVDPAIRILTIHRAVAVVVNLVDAGFVIGFVAKDGRKDLVVTDSGGGGDHQQRSGDDDKGSAHAGSRLATPLPVNRIGAIRSRPSIPSASQRRGPSLSRRRCRAATVTSTTPILGRCSLTNSTVDRPHWPAS